MIKKRGQVWIETVIYTLIAFAIMGMVLAFVKPKIEEEQDKAIIEQSIGMMEDINTLILSMVQGGEGNTRLIEIGIKKGTLIIDGTDDKIIFELEGAYQYSQPGTNITQGNILAHTETQGKLNKVTLTLDYAGRYNLIQDERDEIKTLNKASTAYKLLISHKGIDVATNIPNINIEVI
jgi:hypothetical protein